MRPLLPSLSAGLALLAAGCATSTRDANAPARRLALPAALASGWSAPDFATRLVPAERAAALEACVGAANALGYSVNRVDGASGRIYATRPPSASFDDARQTTLEVGVSSFAPGSARVALSLREAVEAAGDAHMPAMVTTTVVRERAPYDAFFARLRAALAPAGAP